MPSSMAILMQGLVLGVAIAAPVGPIGVLCIRRTLRDGWATGLAAGLGAASADAVYGGLAVAGLAAITSLLIGAQFWLQLVGGLFLIWLGISTLRSTPASPTASTAALCGRGLIQVYLTTFLLTLTNPATILAFVAIFAGLGVSAGSAAHGSILIGGVFLGSALWWLLLSSGTAMIRSRVSQRSLMWVQRGAGLVIGGYGVLALWSLLP